MIFPGLTPLLPFSHSLNYYLLIAILCQVQNSKTLNQVPWLVRNSEGLTEDGRLTA